MVKEPAKAVADMVIGQMFVHGVNLLLSDFGSNHTSSNACVLYLLNILLDTTLGVAIIYMNLRILTYLFSEKLDLKGFESGVYGNPPAFRFWIRQAALYVLALTLMKFFVLGLFAVFPGLLGLGEWLLGWTSTEDGDAVQVIFTIGIFPTIMNIIQFWLIDSIVKASTGLPLSLGTDDTSTRLDHQPLFGVPSDEEDDDDDDSTPHDIENQRDTHRTRSDSRSHIKYSDSNSTQESKSIDTQNSDRTFDAHSYPPSFSNSSDTSSSPPGSGSRSPKPAKNLLKKMRRRSPPRPLNLLTIHQNPINSPLITNNTPQPTPGQSASLKPPTTVQSAAKPATTNEWADSWTDSDNWAERVGEEDWTGRRLEHSKDSLNTTWQAPPIHLGS